MNERIMIHRPCLLELYGNYENVQNQYSLKPHSFPFFDVSEARSNFT